MRRSWAIMSAAAILLLSGAVAVAYPAAAATAGAAARSGRPMGPGGWVSPGGPGDLTAAPQSRMVNGHRQTMVSSSNWSGYAATSTTTQYTSVTASWTQPAGQCSRGDQYSAFWAGLDGYSSPTVEQTGGTLPLTNFGSVNFTSATVNGAGLCKPNPVEIVMPNATPSAISACENFSISYTGRSANPFPFF